MAWHRDWKMRKFLEWCTELPFHDRSRISPTFFIQNTKCFFHFSRNDDYYVLYLYSSTSRRLKSFLLTVYLDFRAANIFQTTEAEIHDSQTCVWTINKSQISDRELNLFNGYFIRFCFLFTKEEGPLLPLEKKIELGDKCVQTGLYLNADMGVESLHDDFSKLLKTGSKYDAEVKCGERTIKAHKIVLSARSEVFKAMLESDMQEGRSGILKIKDIDVNYFQDFMEYLYTGVMPELNFDKAKVLYEVGDKYAIRSLMFRCSDYLQDNLYPENFFECFVLADAHSDQKLKDKIVSFILDKKIYRESENWPLFCENFPKVAVEIYKLSYEENGKE